MFGAPFNRLPFCRGYDFEPQPVSVRDEEVIMLTGLSLAPGESIVIDTDTFTVKKGNDNALRNHSGAWPQIVRGSEKIVFAPNQSVVTVELDYTEAWL